MECTYLPVVYFGVPIVTDLLSKLIFMWENHFKMSLLSFMCHSHVLTGDHSGEQGLGPGPHGAVQRGDEVDEG